MEYKDPFQGMSPDEVRLTRPPLVKVLSQITFPVITSIEKKEFISPFQEALRHGYPTLLQDNGIEISFGPQGGGFAHKKIWRMLDKSGKWRVSLGENFLSLETTEYPGRSEFLKAFSSILEKLLTAFQPDMLERIGLRYINRIPFENRTHLATLVKPEVLGLVREEPQPHLQSSLTDTHFALPDGFGLHGKWGLLSSGQTYDPTVLPPSGQESWILDLDAYVEEKLDFHVQEIGQRLNRLAEFDYRLFRYAVTDTLLEECGGT